MVDSDVLEDIGLEDMPNNDMRLVAESCGIDVAVLLMKNLAGINLSIPKLGFKKLIKRYVVAHYDGHNARELAIKLNVSERFIFKILREAKTSRGKDEQLKLF